MNISKHFTLREATKSNTAIRHGIDNNPTRTHLESLKLLAENVLEPLREHFDKPIYISSGYRSKKLNALVNGSLKSQHCKGQAVDLDNDYRNSVTNEEIYFYILENLDFDMLINEEDFSWLHVSYKKTGNRKQVLKMNNGKYTRLC